MLEIVISTFLNLVILYYFISSNTTTDFDGITILKIPSFKVNPLKTAGLTVSGLSKLLNEFISLAVSTSPVIVLNDPPITGHVIVCLLYTSDAADEEDSVDLGGRR